MKKFRILIIGGTRFVGRALVGELLRNGHYVTISSRRRLKVHPNLIQITCLRESLRNFLESFDEFDYVFDFNAYKQEAILDLPKGYPEFNYYLISSQWVSSYLNYHNVERFTEVELNYIIGKRRLEIAALDRFGPKTRIIRLPVVVGSGDHHHRLDFLVGRILKRDRILVPNSNQLIDIEWVDDIVQTIHLSLLAVKEIPKISRIGLKDGRVYSDFIKEIALTIGRKVEIVDVNTNQQQSNLGDLIKADPFWREEYFDSGDTFLGDVVHHNEIPFKIKMKSICSESVNSERFELASSEEERFLNGRY